MTLPSMFDVARQVGETVRSIILHQTRPDQTGPEQATGAVDVDDAYFGLIRTGWGEGLRRVFNELPRPGWLRV